MLEQYTSIIIGHGILVLTGQIAELAGSLFPLAFLATAVVSACSVYSYVKLSNVYPSTGNIGMFLIRVQQQPKVHCFQW